MFKKEKGFTLIELIIVIFILLMIGVIIFNVNSNKSECINGYFYYSEGDVFIIEKDVNGYPIQCISKK